MLSEGTLALLRRALAERWRNPTGAEGELRDALGVAAAEARARALRPEELIVALKAVLADLAAEQRNAEPGDETRLREWAVKACIEAYYRER
jgi:hypothetical protein